MACPKLILGILMLFIYNPALGCNNKSETSVCSVIKPGHYTPYNTTWTMGCLVEGDSVSKIESENQFTDRKWNFDCRPSNLTLGTTDACSLIETSQQSLENIHYMCKGGIISGFKTIYRPLFKDRVWMFYCCPVAETLVDCRKSGFVNRFNQDLSFIVPLGYYLHGVESFHDFTSNGRDQRINGTRFHQGYRRIEVQQTFHQEYKRDRRWSYTICKADSKKPRSIISSLGCNNKSLSSVVDVRPGFYTPYNKTWTMACQKKGDSISKVQSHYDSYFMDRNWKFDCRPSNIRIKSCSMVITKQKMLDNVVYGCKGGIITGFKSVFSFELKDRVWMFYCCPVADTLIDCKNSYFITDDYEEDFSFDIPKGYHLHGVESFHRISDLPWEGYNYERDRLWSYTFCKISVKKTVPVIPTFGCKNSVTSVGNIMPSHCTPYQKDWTMKCPKGDSISKIQSHHDVLLADRIWKFDCRQSNLEMKNCSLAWTGQESLFKLQYTCEGGIIAGFRNQYDHLYKDQVWIVNCCPIAERLVDCKNSGFVNNFYKDVHFDIPQGYYLHGVESVHDFNDQSHYARDRRWRYTFCKVASKNITVVNKH